MCTLCGVSRLNIYLPDGLAAEAKKAGLNLSAVTQEAVRRSLAARSTDQWLASLSAREPQSVSHDSVIRALEEVREQAPTHDA